MPIVDLTSDFRGERYAPEISRNEVHLKSGLTKYTGIVYDIKMDGMTGTYIDFPGHIAETDNGLCADNCPLDLIYRCPAGVIHLNCKSGDGAVGAEVLENAYHTDKGKAALIINALGELPPGGIDNRSVYLDDSAVQWIIDSGCKLLVSDIYESKALHGVFLKLFQAGITTVCIPANLHKLTAAEVELTVLFPKMPGITQLPCRMIAEF
jgi:kynurenine formamidase